MNLGKLVRGWDGEKLSIESYQLHAIDDSIAADREIADEIEALGRTVSASVFASRGYHIDQPLAVAPRDLPNTFTDIAASTPLANLVTDAFRQATGADIGFTANGMPRTGGASHSSRRSMRPTTRATRRPTCSHPRVRSTGPA